MNPRGPNSNEQADLFKRISSLFIVIVAVMVVFFIVMRFTTPSENPSVIDYKTFYGYLVRNQVQTFHARGLNADGTLTGGKPFAVGIPNRDTAFVNELARHVKGTVTFDNENGNSAINLVLTFLPFFIVAILVFVILRSAQRRLPPN